MNEPQIKQHKIEELYDKGLISYRSYLDFLQQITPVNWIRWLNSHLFFLATMLFLLGIIFFLAYNWFIIPKFIKLGACLILILLSSIFAVYKGFESIAGTGAAFATCFFVGAFCAVFGQIYQTGANSHMLFLTWAALILPFAFIINKSSVWLLIAVLINTTFFLLPSDSNIMIWFGLNLLIIIISNLPIKVCNQQAYFYYLTNTYVTVFIAAKAVIALWPNFRSDMITWSKAEIYFFLIWIIINSVYHFFKKPNIYFISISAVAFSIFLLDFLFIKIAKIYDEPNIKFFFTMAMIFLIITIAVSFVLVKIHRILEAKIVK